MPVQQTRDALGYVQALGPVIAAFVAVGVAAMQWYLQHKKMQQDLFEKRFKVYRAVEEYAKVVIAGGQLRLDDSRTTTLSEETRSAEFLFGSDVVTFLKDLYPKIGGLALEHFRIEDRIEKRLNADGFTEMDSAALQQMRSNFSHVSILRLMPLVYQANDVFRPYLQIHHERLWISRFARRLNRWVEDGEGLKR